MDPCSRRLLGYERLSTPENYSSSIKRRELVRWTFKVHAAAGWTCASLVVLRIMYFTPLCGGRSAVPYYDEEVDSPVAEALPNSKFLQKADLLALFRYVGDNLGIPMEDDVPCTSTGLVQEFHSHPPTSLAVNKEVLFLLLQEWMDPEKTSLGS
ncbi:hypothetical protein NDU88_001662 [Pleurodeles waltl]|uniref:Uncharacterized protein n=1 Tax=Pleurodeles waltl TaxID=8319 RepID=A0AAV7VX31_PLEWA|nr:hypothetical protein NDU88_001662 [Pleurodeles waltl]